MSGETNANKKALINRRYFLKLTGTTLVALIGGRVWRAIDQGVFSVGEGPAYEPWKDWQTDAETGPLALVSAAILAANPHNTQPWLFRVTDARIDLFADTTRNIGTIDPYLREMYVGMGCALENLLLAAPANGYHPALTLLPDPDDPAHIARVDVNSDPNLQSQISNLYHAIPHRHTNRGPYESRPLPDDALAALDALGADDPEVSIFWFTGDAERRQIADPIYAASEAITADQQQSHDSAQWFRHDWDELQRRRDGITLDAQSGPALMRALGKMLPPLSQEQNDQFWLQATRTQVDTAATFGTLAVPDARDNADRIRAGRLWQRMHLWATTQGLAMQPLNQMPERADREDSLRIEPTFGNVLRELVGDEAWQALMPLRVGYPTVKALPSPRRTVEEVRV